MFTGSPPRVWGKHFAAHSREQCFRFTPTCVGKTSSKKVTPVPSPVHPHVCGENSRARWNKGSILGSPPRVWGKHMLGVHRIVCDWFTPTCVGKTLSKLTNSLCSTVHPHVCGENQPIHERYTGKVGSPPRVWGKQVMISNSDTPFRFTPTCVGKTFGGGVSRDVRLVHPHVCGENVGQR